MWLLIDQNKEFPVDKPFTEKFLLFDDPLKAKVETIARGFASWLGGLQDPATMKVGMCQMYKSHPIDLELYRLEPQ